MSAKVRDPQLAQMIGQVTGAVDELFERGKEPGAFIPDYEHFWGNGTRDLDRDAAGADGRAFALGGGSRGVDAQSLRFGPENPKIHVACSGGADSMLLLYLLRRLSHRMGLRLSVGHMDHGLRTESREEAEVVQRYAESLGLECEVQRLALGPQRSDLAQRARIARYQALWRQARKRGAAVIALAHSATDQAETMLLHASRGAGIAGIAGMRQWRAPCFRPLLSCSRDSLRRMAGRLDLPFVDDPSNVDPKHPRVRIRHRVLPELEGLNPRLEVGFGELALQAQDAVEALESWRDREFAQFETGDPGRFTLEALDRLPRAVASLVLRKICAQNGVDLSELSYRVQRDIVQKAQLRAAAYSGRSKFPAGGFTPLRYHLRPRRILRLQRNELIIEVSQEAGERTRG